MDLKERLQYILKNNKVKPNITEYEFAKSIGTYPSKFAEIRSGKVKTLAPDIALEISNQYKINFKWLLTGEGSIFIEENESNNTKTTDIIEIERIEGIHPECGFGCELYGEPNIEPFRISRQSIVTYLRCTSPGNLKTFQAAGDSMEKTISHGDWLLIDTSFKDASISGVYIFTANGKYRCKRLNLTLDGSLEVKSDNPLYKDEIVNLNDNIEINIIGRVLNNLSRGL